MQLVRVKSQFPVYIKMALLLLLLRCLVFCANKTFMQHALLLSRRSCFHYMINGTCRSNTPIHYAHSHTCTPVCYESSFILIMFPSSFLTTAHQKRIKLWTNLTSTILCPLHKVNELWDVMCVHLSICKILHRNYRTYFD